MLLLGQVQARQHKEGCKGKAAKARQGISRRTTQVSSKVAYVSRLLLSKAKVVMLLYKKSVFKEAQA